jgi:DNA helicase HerA-like ATPase
MSERIILIFGKTGTGKTTLAKELIKNERRVIIVDALQEYTGLILEDFESTVEFFRNKPKEFKLVCRYDSDLAIEYLFKLIFEIGDICLVVEEAEIYISPYAKSSSFLRLVRYGRHRNIKIIGVARRTSELSLDFRAQVNKIYSFKQTQPRDLQLMQELGFENLDKLGEHEYAEQTY